MVNEDQSERPPTKESSSHTTVVEHRGHIPWVAHRMDQANGMTKEATARALKSMKPRPLNWIGRWARSQGGVLIQTEDTGCPLI